MVVTARNLLHAALWLVVSLFGVAVLYAILQANFLAVVQVVVYIGAIAILFIFAVMLTRRELMEKGQQTRSNWWIPALLGVVDPDRAGVAHPQRSGRGPHGSGPAGRAGYCPGAWHRAGFPGCLRAAFRSGFRAACWRRWSARSTLRPWTKSRRPTMSIPLSWYLILAAALFCIGLFGVLSRKNAIAILLGMELMLNAVNINLVAFWRYRDPRKWPGRPLRSSFSPWRPRKWPLVWR